MYVRMCKHTYGCMHIRTYVYLYVFAFTEKNQDTFMEKYLKAKHALGSEKLKLLKILFFGPAGAGKTTLLDVLLQDGIRSLRESTGVLDLKLVEFKVAIEADAAKSMSQWRIVTLQQEILRLRHAIEKRIEEYASKDDNPLLVDTPMPNMKIDGELQLVMDDKFSADEHVSAEQISNSYKQAIPGNTLMVCYDSGG